MNSENLVSSDVWEHTPPEAPTFIRALEARLVGRETFVRQLQEPLQEHALTSARPPSSAPPQVLGMRPRREPSGRRPGGQPSHAGQARARLPVAETDVVLPVKSVRCQHCQPLVHGEDRQPQRHQVTAIRPMRPVVTEYQVQQLCCPVCGETTRAERPRGVPTGYCGPRVQAITALCTGA